MTKARERRARRTMPPPRHPIPVGAAEPMDVEAAAKQSRRNWASRPSQPAKAPTRAGRPSSIQHSCRRRRQRQGRAPVLLGRPLVYLDEAHVDFLDQARIAGLMSRPRLDISKSAVVRASRNSSNVIAPPVTEKPARYSSAIKCTPTPGCIVVFANSSAPGDPTRQSASHSALSTTTGTGRSQA
jgi:hypothetical protein